MHQVLILCHTYWLFSAVYILSLALNDLVLILKDLHKPLLGSSPLSPESTTRCQRGTEVEAGAACTGTFAPLQLCTGSQRVSPAQLRAELAAGSDQAGRKRGKAMASLPFSFPASFRSQHTELKRTSENKKKQIVWGEGKKRIDRVSGQSKNFPKLLHFHLKYVLKSLRKNIVINFHTNWYFLVRYKLLQAI